MRNTFLQVKGRSHTRLIPPHAHARMCVPLHTLGILRTYWGITEHEHMFFHWTCTRVYPIVIIRVRCTSAIPSSKPTELRLGPHEKYILGNMRRSNAKTNVKIKSSGVGLEPTSHEGGRERPARHGRTNCRCSRGKAASNWAALALPCPDLLPLSVARPPHLHRRALAPS